MRHISGNAVLSLGLLLLAAALLLEDLGLPHGVNLLLMVTAVAIELLGTARRCKEKK